MTNKQAARYCDTLAQDGVRIRASAGAASFRREATLDRHLATAQAVVAELKREVGRLVVQTTATVTGKVLTPEDQRRLAEETAKQVAV